MVDIGFRCRTRAQERADNRPKGWRPRVIARIRNALDFVAQLPTERLDVETYLGGESMPPGSSTTMTGGGNSERLQSVPIKLTSRLHFLERLLVIQAEVNAAAVRTRRPLQWVIPPADEARIRELVAANTWPRGWAGTEPGADEYLHEVRRDGTIQLNLLAEW